MAGSTGKGSGTKKKQDKAPAEPVTGLESILKKEPALKTTLQQIEKQFGEGSIMPLGGETQLKIEGISTGSLSLDLALGGIGLPRVGSSRSLVRSLAVRQRLRCTFVPRLKRPVVSLRSSMLSMPLTQAGVRS